MAIEFNKNIYDKFIYQDTEYVILNDRMSYNTSLNKRLMIGKVRITDNTKEIIALADEKEYNDVAQYYLMLKSAFQKEPRQ